MRARLLGLLGAVCVLDSCPLPDTTPARLLPSPFLLLSDPPLTFHMGWPYVPFATGQKRTALSSFTWYVGSADRYPEFSPMRPG